jgi:AcrR family transcriptional regulator
MASRFPQVPTSGEGQLTERGEKVRHRMLLAAKHLILSEGLHRVSVDRILEASATGKSQFYHYFESKAQLVDELWSFVLSDARRVIGRHLRRQRHWVELQALMREIVSDAQLAPGCAVFPLGLVAFDGRLGGTVGEVATEVPDFTEVDRALHDRVRSGQPEREAGPSLDGELRCPYPAGATLELMHQGLAGFFADMKKLGLLRSEADANGLATLVVSAWQGGLLMALTLGRTQPLEDALAQAYSFVWSWREGDDLSPR